METKNKMERLLDMIEHPDQYSEEDIRQMLEDDECREYYELMVKTDNAYSAMPNIDVDKALRKFEAHRAHRFSWHNVAAIIIGVLMISGIAFATISLSRHFSESQQTHSEITAIKATTKKAVEKEGIAKTDSIVEKEKAFDDIELQTILNEISVYYNVKVEYHSDASKHLRLHFHWDKTQDVNMVVEALNHFEKVKITLTNDKMEVK